MNKKKIIVAVVVFLLLGTMVYSFATPSDQDDKLEGNNPPTQEQGGNQGDEQKDPEDDNQNDDEEDDNTIPVVNNNTNYYQLALEAVIKAEQSLSQDDVDNAKDLIADVNGEDALELVDRITNVQNTIDFDQLLKELENKTNTSTNKEELDLARKYNIDNDLATKLSNLVDNDNKANLKTRYDNVLVKLNDTTAPRVSGITNGELTNKVVTLTIEDEGSFTATLNGDVYVMGNEIKEDGDYTLVVTDASFNETVVTFTIETVKPEVIEITQTYEEKGTGRIKVVIKTSEEIFGDLINSSEWRKVSGKENEYYNYYFRTKEVTLNFTDKAGNEGTYSFTVDMTKPTAEITMSNNNGLTSTNQDVTVTLVASEDIADIEGWTKVDSKTFTKVYSENGKYSVEISDLVGNKNTINFEVKRIDKVAPVLTVVEPNRYFIEVNTPYVDKGYSAYDVVDKDLTNRVTMTYQFLPKGSGNWLTVSGVDTSLFGTYKITYQVSDKAGNIAKGTRSFEVIDSSMPVITVKEESIGTFEENIFSKVSFKLFDEHMISKVIINGVEKTLTPNSWGDLNDISVSQNGGIYGENSLVLVDVYGNETEYKFILDNKVPQLKPTNWTVTIEADQSKTFTCPDMTEYGFDEYGVRSVVLDQYFNDHLTNVDVTKPGQFVCRYKTTDKAGNSAYNDIKYQVVDTTEPTITINNWQTLNLEIGSTYVDEGATAYDRVDGDLTEQIKTTYLYYDQDGNRIFPNPTEIKLDKVGQFVIVYSVTDNAGNREELARRINVVDTQAPDLKVDNIVDGVVSVNDPQIHATDLSEFTVTIKLNDQFNHERVATLNSNNLYSIWFGIGYLPDGNYEVTATDLYGNSKTVSFTVDRLKLVDSKVGSNLIDETTNTINNFNSFAIKFNRDLTFTNYSLTEGFKIEIEYSTDGENYTKSNGTVVSNFWTSTLGSSTTEKYQGETFTVSANSPIYWSGTKVGSRWTDVYNAILATKDNDDKVYVRTVFTVIQPTYEKSFTLDEVVYSKGGTEVTPRGLADFNEIL